MSNKEPLTEDTHDRLLVSIARIDERTLNLVQQVNNIDFKLENKYVKQDAVDQLVRNIKNELAIEMTNQKAQVSDLRKICYWAIGTAITELLAILGYLLVKFIQ